MLGKTNAASGGSISDQNALLLVNAPSGSTVTVVKGSVSLRGTTIANSADASLETHVFRVPAAQLNSTPWTVTATLGTLTAGRSVTIDRAGSYLLTLYYYLYLYNAGDENTAATGGWEAKAIRYAETQSGWQVTAKAPQITRGTASMTVSLVPANANASGSVITGSKIDLSYFSVIHFHINLTEYHTGDERIYVSQSNTEFAAAKVVATHAEGEQTLDLDVSDLSGEYYVGLNLYAAGTGTATVVVYDILAEP